MNFHKLYLFYLRIGLSNYHQISCQLVNSFTCQLKNNYLVNFFTIFAGALNMVPCLWRGGMEIRSE